MPICTLWRLGDLLPRQMAHVTASCPGKVLVVGGYLVLQDDVPGCVLAATARFHSTVATVEAGGPDALAPPPAVAALVAEAAATGCAAGAWVVQSPQFGASWWYAVTVRHPQADRGLAGELKLTPNPAPGAGRNPFVEAALHTALVALVSAAGWERLGALVAAAPEGAGRLTCVTLRADNDFYSQRAALLERGLPLTIAALRSLPPFLPCPRDASTGKAVVSKTGLGSSAALVTSLVAAVASHVLSPAAPVATPWCDRAWVHAVAQVAHGWAQGKVGSGFDVASAAFGSLSYTRIPAAVLGRLMERVEAAATSRADVGAVGAELCYLAADDAAAAAGWRFGAVSCRRRHGLGLQCTTLPRSTRARLLGGCQRDVSYVANPRVCAPARLPLLQLRLCSHLSLRVRAPAINPAAAAFVQPSQPACARPCDRPCCSRIDMCPPISACVRTPVRPTQLQLHRHSYSHFSLRVRARAIDPAAAAPPIRDPHSTPLRCRSTLTPHRFAAAAR
jgi:hypothetical protein